MGPTGRTGYTGPRGPTGRTGYTGPRGIQGRTGFTGQPGRDGSPGGQGIKTRIVLQKDRAMQNFEFQKDMKTISNRKCSTNMKGICQSGTLNVCGRKQNHPNKLLFHIKLLSLYTDHVE